MKKPQDDTSGGKISKQQRKRTMSISDDLETSYPRLMSFIEWTGAPRYFLGKMTVPNCGKDEWDPRLICCNLILAPILIVFTFSSPPYFDYITLLWAAIAGGVLAGAFIGTAYLPPSLGGSPNTEPKWRVFLIILAIVTSVAWLYIIANELVDALSLIGLILDINEALLGLTILCWGNNISDVIGVVTVAKLGYPEMALGAVWASPLLDTTLTAGVGWVVKTSTDGTTTYPYDFALLISAIWMIAIALISIAYYEYMSYKLHKRFSYFLVGFYIVYLVIVIAGPQDSTV